MAWKNKTTNKRSTGRTNRRVISEGLLKRSSLIVQKKIRKGNYEKSLWSVKMLIKIPTSYQLLSSKIEINSV